jgi:hypothetical protein
MEEFKIIVECPKYSVSNLGNVKNINTEKILKPSLHTDGYKQVTLHVEKNKIITRKVHRLVANAFIPNPENKECIDHINGNRIDNRIENLRWATKSENSINKITQSNNTSGFAGVCYDKTHNKWNAYYTLQRRQYKIGSFKTLEEAKEQRIKKANEVFGEFTSRIEKIRQFVKNELDELEREFDLRFGN